MKTALCAIVAILFAVPAFAQVPPIVNPTTIQFTASADHDAVQSGLPVVSKYTVDVMSASAPTGTVWKTVDLGKPTPVSGQISFAGMGTALSTLNPGSYVAVVKAEGPGGVTASVPSDPFQVAIKAPAAPGKPVWK